MKKMDTLGHEKSRKIKAMSRKKYSPPRIVQEHIFEARALGCATKPGGCEEPTTLY